MEAVLAAGLVWDAPRGLYGGLRVRHFGAYPLIEDNSVRAAANTIANISLGYALGSGVRIWAQLMNVLDEQHNDIEYWYESRLEGEPAAGVADRHFKPVEPRQMRAGVSYGL
jgi:hypothetical protein